MDNFIMLHCCINPCWTRKHKNTFNVYKEVITSLLNGSAEMYYETLPFFIL